MEGKTLDADSVQVITDIAQTASALPAPLPEYSAEDFNKNLSAWRNLIESGKSTPERIISMVQSKGVLSEKQKQTIFNLMPSDTNTAAVENAQ